MKFLKINLVALLLVSLISCQKQTVDKDPVQQNEDKIEAIFDQVNKDNSNGESIVERDAVSFTISMKNGKFVAENIEYLSEDNLQFGLGFVGASEDPKRNIILIDGDDILSTVGRSELSSIADQIEKSKEKSLSLVMRK